MGHLPKARNSLPATGSGRQSRLRKQPSGSSELPSAEVPKSRFARYSSRTTSPWRTRPKCENERNGCGPSWRRNSLGIVDFHIAVRFTNGGAEMKYMLLIYADENAWTETERQECYGESTQLCHQLKSKGQYLDANPLQSVTTATSIQERNGKRLG